MDPLVARFLPLSPLRTLYPLSLILHDLIKKKQGSLIHFIAFYEATSPRCARTWKQFKCRLWTRFKLRSSLQESHIFVKPNIITPKVLKCSKAYLIAFMYLGVQPKSPQLFDGWVPSMPCISVAPPIDPSYPVPSPISPASYPKSLPTYSLLFYHIL
jgi:hypothetical protein